MPIKFANNAKTTLSSGVSPSATSIAVADGSVFPSITASDYFLATLVDSGDNTEIVKVTALSGNTLTVSRAREGTAARSFESGDKVEVRLTAGGLSDISTTTDLNLSTMTGDGSSTTLALSVEPTTGDNTQVYIDGVYQNKTTYAVSGTTLTFSTAPPTGSEVEVIIINPAAGLSSSTDYATAAQGNKADNALPKSGGAMTGAITTNSTIDGRDVAADGAKLDTIEANADQTDTANVVASLTAGTNINIANDGTVSTSATANDSDTNLKNRANHTGNQSISTVTGLQAALDAKEPTIAKNTAFNKNFGTASGTVTEGNDSRLSDSRTCNNSFDNATTAKINLSLENVENKSSATIRGELVESDIPASIARDSELTSGLAGKVDTVSGKQLSTNDFTNTLKSKLDGIEPDATADQTDAEIETAYNAQVARVSSAEKTAGTVTAVRRFSPSDIKAMAAVHDTLPIGSFILWGSDTIPSGYLLVNGASLSRSTYSDLFAVIGTAFGAADSSHFNLPPTGTFIRITANGSANDPDRASRTASATGGNTGDNVGSFQSDKIKSHTHDLHLKRTDSDGGGYVPNNSFAFAFRKNTTGNNQSGGDLLTDRQPNTASHVTQSAGGNETRPVNVNFNLIVKYAA